MLPCTIEAMQAPGKGGPGMGTSVTNRPSPEPTGRVGGAAGLWEHVTMRERDGADRHPLPGRDDGAIDKDAPALPPPAPARQRCGLPDQGAFEDELRRCIEHSTRLRRRFALLLVDLDRFERIRHDTGPAGGDQVLARVAHRLRSQIRSTDMAARLDLEAFAVLLAECPTHDAAAHWARKIIAAVGRPIEVDGGFVMVTASVGVALFGADGWTADELMRAAAAALAHARRNGGRQVAFDPGR